MGFVPLICRCYEFLCICLPFDGRFSVVPNHTIFACQKKINWGVYWAGNLLFLFSSSRLLNPIQSFQKFGSITESFILYFSVLFFLCHFWCHIHHSWCHPLLLGCHFLSLEYHSLSLGCHFGCHSEFSVHFFVSVYFVELLSTFSVYIFAIMFTIFII